MKKILLLLLFSISTFSQAQIVTIPDPVFKAKLLAAGPTNQIAYANGGYIKIDANNDGNIQVAEALAVDSLNVRVDLGFISNMTGIGSFTNLKKLDCNNHSIATLDVSALTNLTNLYCYSNNLTSLNVSTLTQLKKLSCGNNALNTLDVSALQDLRWLECSATNLTTLDVSGLAHLESLICEEGLLSSLQLNGATALTELRCNGNNLTALDLTGLTSLQRLFCESNQLTNLDLTVCPAIEGVMLGGNQIQVLEASGLQHLVGITASINSTGGIIHTIYASGCPSLVDITARDHQLADLDVSNCPALERLILGHNQLTAIDVSDCPLLTQLFVEENQLTTLDLTHNPNLIHVVIDLNPITSLFIKNGHNDMVGMDGLYMEYICADESEIASLQQQSSGWLFNDFVVINSYCSFSPGGAYNTLKGTVRLDADSNGCNAGDVLMGNLRIGITTDSDSGSVFSNADGNYTFYTQAPSLTLTPSFENPTYFNCTPSSQVFNFPTIDNSIHIGDFCITPNGSHTDVEVIVAPLTSARPGFDASYSVCYKNKGNQTVSGQIAFGYDDSVLDFVTSDAAPIQSEGSLNFSYSNLKPFESRSIFVILNVNSPMETPSVNIDDVLSLTAGITSNLSPDETPNDNTTTLNQIVVGSFDPNNKHCLEGATVNPSEIGKYLNYVINFENTGTAAAENIVIRDDIDVTKFDLASLQLLSTSHQAQVRITGNKVEFIFQGINLEPNVGGNVFFKIKTKNTLVANAVVTNKADIFFDYNFPVQTDPAITTFSVLATDQFTTGDSVSIYPNPAGDFVKVQSEEPIKSIELFDVQGRIVHTSIVESKETTMNLNRYSKGVYYLRVQTENGVKSEKLIKK